MKCVLSLLEQGMFLFKFSQYYSMWVVDNFVCNSMDNHVSNHMDKLSIV